MIKHSLVQGEPKIYVNFGMRPPFSYVELDLSLCHSIMSDSSVTPCTLVHQAPLDIGFSRQEY